MQGIANESYLIHIFFSELILASTAYIIFYEDMWISARKVLTLLWSAFCILFPFWLATLLFGLGVYGNSVLRKANQYKISKNQIPITSLDITITARNPVALLLLFNYSKRWLLPISLGLVVLGTGLFIAIGLFLLPQSQLEFLHLMIVCFLFVVIFLYFKRRLFTDVCDHLTQDFPFGLDVRNHMGGIVTNWEFDRIALLSQHLGMPAFILYTHILAKKDTPAFFKSTKVPAPIPVNAAVKAAEHYIPSLPIQSRDYQYPNIVVMQCESVFDPARAFILSTDYKSSLFTKNQYTKCICSLRVNIIGGGSWVSEFEFLTGLDTRPFGYIGYYSHVTLAPYVVSAFPAFLNNLGYTTKTFYPATGSFYNAEKAYLQYGFNQFLDSRALNLPHEWSSSDVDMAHAFIQHTPDFSATPLFSFIVTNGAHSPYNTDNFLQPTQWSTKFAVDCDPRMNAQINEYIKLLGQTEDAIQLILDKLVQIEQSTGRPFLLLIYGDHQPHGFTDTWDDERNYDAVRSAAPKNQTFAHVMSSMDNFTLNFQDEIPLTLLSSIISAAVVTQYSDLYALPNFYLYEKNGADTFPGLHAPRKFGIKQDESIVGNNFSIDNLQAIDALKKLNIMG